MPRTKTTTSESIKELRAFALKYPETQEGVACEGTVIEKRTIKVRNKAFLFIGTADLMLKLGASLGEATALAGKHPDRYRVGAHDWVSVLFSSDNFPPLEMLEKWVDESYRLNAGKKLVAMLEERK
jgi:hypothetical protein